MARARTKEELLKQGEQKFDELIALLDSIPKEKRNELFQFGEIKDPAAHWKRDKNVKDVLIHLYEWHQLLLEWVESNQNGTEKQFLVEGYNWKTYGEMNLLFIDKHSETSFDEAYDLFKESHTKVMTLADQYSDEELFTKKVFKWVGGSSLGAYFVSAAPSHYDWAIKKIKKHKQIIEN
ncbi:hypothetical protein IGI37_001113 [Enterococcus sp. AZ194]|uniref:ClbS/DfsB family four-helix bundle protein n=1 Tax=Enterococcus sp. AZ194 TaxID=2774629 RepID=UPI003F2476CC